MPAKKLLTSTDTKPAAAPKALSFAPIDRNCDYPLSLFKAMTGLNTAALRQARHNGLVVLTFGRMKWIRGRDFAAYLDKLAMVQLAPQPTRGE
jgi:hypothetical protein